MLKKLYLNILWHMHQPYYKNDRTGSFEMPWVFLHAIKDYYDLPWYLSRYPNLKATFNLVPSLLVQLKAYESFEVDDRLLKLLRQEVDALSNDDRLYLLEILFFAQKETMLEPIPRYAELHRKMDRREILKKNGMLPLNDQEILDLQVCFLLAWCGEYLRDHSDLVAKLLTQHTFSQGEKITLLKELALFVKKIIPFYGKLAQKGQIEISSTPFYHPIMPLLMDSENGKRANAHTTLPGTAFAFPDDARLHLQKAQAYHAELFGSAPSGYWPSEGSVDESSVALYMDSGAKWIGTDEEVLYKSLASWDKAILYKHYRYKKGGDTVSMMFRDRNLSDAIGFDYSRMEPDAAAGDFIARLKAIFEGSDASRSVNVILDGENAWEFYRNNARDFFEALYRQLDGCEWIVTQRMSEAAENETVPTVSLVRFEPGSWINGDFGIWIGQDEKNRAWELLAQTQKDAGRFMGNVSKDVAQQIQNEVMIAQGSDWFWWFGDTHFTAQKAEFDMLFRTHLINVYELAKKEAPALLFKPIIRQEHRKIHIPPKNPITVRADGRKSSFFEWMGAGEFDLGKMGGAMDSSTPYVKKLLYGSDGESFSFNLIGSFSSLLGSCELEIAFNGKMYRHLLLENITDKDISLGCGQEFIEVSLPQKRLDGNQLEMKIRLLKGEEVLQTIPFHGTLGIELRDRYPDHWFI